jgi:hypothetical protein
MNLWATRTALLLLLPHPLSARLLLVAHMLHLPELRPFHSRLLRASLAAAAAAVRML